MGEDESVSNSSKGAASNASKAPLPVPSLAPASWWWWWWWRWCWSCWWWWCPGHDDFYQSDWMRLMMMSMAVLSIRILRTLSWCERKLVFGTFWLLPFIYGFSPAGCCPSVQSWKMQESGSDGDDGDCDGHGGDVEDFPDVFFIISHWHLSWNTIDKSK